MHNNRVTETVEVPIHLAMKITRGTKTENRKKLVAKRKRQRLARAKGRK